MGLVVVVIDAHLRVRLRQLHHSTRILFLLPWETISIPPKNTAYVWTLVHSSHFCGKSEQHIEWNVRWHWSSPPCLDPALGRLLVGTLYITLLYQQMVKYLVTVTKNCSPQLWVVNEPEGKIFPEMVNMFVLNICGLWKQTTLDSLVFTEIKYETSLNNIVPLIEQ